MAITEPVTSPISELAARLRADLGASTVSTDLARLRRASTDWAHMSPILKAKLPAGMAELVVTPRHADQVPVVLRHAYELDVPVTPRGTGLGNYGQAIPLHGGLVLDLSECRRVARIDEGSVTAEAGVRMRDLDRALQATGQELTMFPSTKGSTLGGFLAGGNGGTGSLMYGTNADGFVHALDIAPCDGSGELRHIEGAATLPYIHAYGISGIIARATVQVVPAQQWVGVFCAWDDYDEATAGMRALLAVDPSPRLISLDEAAIVAVLPSDSGLDPQRLSVRAIVPIETVNEVRDVVARHGGTVLEVRPGSAGPDRISSISFNHSTFHLQKRRPDYFHLEVAGDPLWKSPDAVRAIYPETVLHLELMRTGFVGMLMARFQDEQTVEDGILALEAIGVRVHSPHTWMLDRRIEEVLAVVPDTDPRGLLNPGKLPVSA